MCVLLFVVLAAICGCISAQQCVTPVGEVGICKSISSCPVLLQNLRLNSTDDRNFFLRSVCQTEQVQTGFVCCGSYSTYPKANKPVSVSNKFDPDPNPVNLFNKFDQQNPTQQNNQVSNGFSNKFDQASSQPTVENRFNFPDEQDDRKYISKPSCGISIEPTTPNRPYTGLKEWPWMALIQYNTSDGIFPEFQCDGVLISDRYVLTAAQCVVGEIQDSTADRINLVRLGEYDTRQEVDCVQDSGCNERYMDVPVEKIIVPKGYLENRNNFKHRYNDLALIKLAYPVKTTVFINPICLPNNQRATANDLLQVGGWGLADRTKGTVSPIKTKRNMLLVPQEECSKIYKQLGVVIQSNQICAMGSADNSCRIKGGQPLVNQISGKNSYYLEGIVSYGAKPCGTPGVPDVYTRVSEFMGWIQSYMN